ncbi:MAG: hypothetical protein IJV22_00665 [Bacteroidales bacterium]|nr:hypothetical protein [Bacteroidales bacterium]
MISVIICSRKQDISIEQRHNIESTIGCDHEIIVIDNSQNKYSIFSAYNVGIEHSRVKNGGILCFMHEDAVMHSYDWGREVQNIFTQHTDCGCLGVIGGHILLNHPCYWSDSFLHSYYYYQKYGSKTKLVNETRFFNEAGFSEVAVCDGVWMCIPSKLFSKEKICFDTKTYDGFHMYDMDICMQIRAIGMKTLVTKNILLEHRNNIEQSLSSTFFEAQKVWYEKWKDSLPLIVGLNSSQLIDGLERWADHLQRITYNHGVFITSQTPSYRLGQALLQPLVWVKHLFHR